MDAPTSIATTGVFGFEIVALLLGATGGWLGGELVDRRRRQRREPERTELDLRPIGESSLRGRLRRPRHVAAGLMQHRTLA
jgi:hypothetical protein